MWIFEYCFLVKQTPIFFYLQIWKVVFYSVCFSFSCRTLKKIFWRMLVTVSISIDFHCMGKQWKSMGTEIVWLPKFFKTSPLMFHRIKVWNDTSMDYSYSDGLRFFFVQHGFKSLYLLKKTNKQTNKCTTSIA